MDESYYQSETWRRKRLERLKFAQHRCELCNRGHDLQVHHRTYARFGKEIMQDLIALCRPCHERFHKHKDAIQISERWVCDAFKCGVLWAVRTNPPAHRYGLFRRDHDIVLRPFNLKKDPFQHEANEMARRAAKWIVRGGYAGIPDLDEHTAEVVRGRAAEKRERSLQRRASHRTSAEIWFEEFEPRIRAVFDEYHAGGD